MENDESFLRTAIECSKESAAAGNFPAGGIVVKDGNVLSSEMSSPYPGLFHADSKAVTRAFESSGVLNGATLYVGLEPCLMCSSVAYWSGIRRIVFAVPKSKVSGDYYETHADTRDVVYGFNEPIEMVHMDALERDALEVIRIWEKQHAS